jgi:hypothetical protein
VTRTRGSTSRASRSTGEAPVFEPREGMLVRNNLLHSSSTLTDDSLHRYTTYRALLYYLYLGEIDFTPPASDYLVALSGQDVSNLPTRRTFLVEKSKRTLATVKPASPHCVYQLADKLDCEELKEKAKKAIIGGFSPENVRTFVRIVHLVP